MKKISIIGAGSWGTALAIAANRAGCDITLWDRNQEKVDNISNLNLNDEYLRGIFIDPAIRVTSDIAEACACDLIIIAVPAQSVRATCINFSQHLKAGIPVLIAAKGIERGSYMLMSEVVAGVLPSNPLAVLSGPNFAIEIARGLPAATTIATVNQHLGSQIISALGSGIMRPYYTNDIVGTQVGGALKNVIAIACGITIGKSYGENARAAIITRGLAEMRRFCTAKGGRMETLMGLSGIGDLMLTCSSTLSRNLSFGVKIASSQESAEELLSGSSSTIEGAFTAEAAVDLANKLGVNVPICKAIRDILNGDLSIDDAISALMSRPFTTE